MSPSAPRGRGEDSYPGVCRRLQRAPGTAETTSRRCVHAQPQWPIEISSNLFAQTPADILINNLVNAAQQQEGSPGTKESSTKRGAADETEGVLDAASSPRRQERDQPGAGRAETGPGQCYRGAQTTSRAASENCCKRPLGDREDEDEPGRRSQRKIQEVDEDEMDEEPV